MLNLKKKIRRQKVKGLNFFNICGQCSKENIVTSKDLRLAFFNTNLHDNNWALEELHSFAFNFFRPSYVSVGKGSLGNKNLLCGLLYGRKN